MSPGTAEHITDEAVTQVVRHVDRERRRDAEHCPAVDRLMTRSAPLIAHRQ